MQNLYFFIMISRKSDAEELIELYKKHEVPQLYSMLAHGTAKSQILDLWGIEQSEKAVHQTVVTYNKMREIIEVLEKEFQIDLPDRGIALAVPLTSISTKNALDSFAGAHAEDNMMDIEPKEKAEMELIVAICNKGYTEDVMEAARKAGAGGGTILHVKGTGTEYAEKFLGISIVDEKEAGFALFFHNFSTFLGKPGLYIEDLFILPEYRGRGYGRALIDHLRQIAKDRGCGRVEWWCLDSNEPAIGFYRSIGAEPMSDWTVFRISEPL